MLEYIVLGMLNHQSYTGYDLKKAMESSIGVFYKASFGSLYPILNKHTLKGNLVMTEQMQGNRTKKLYEITEQGKEVFREWLLTPLGDQENTNSRLVKVYFFDQLPEDNRREQLTEYERKNLNYLKELETLWKYYDQLDNKELFYYKMATLYYGISIVKENIRWYQLIREKKPLVITDGKKSKNANN